MDPWSPFTICFCMWTSPSFCSFQFRLWKFQLQYRKTNNNRKAKNEKKPQVIGNSRHDISIFSFIFLFLSFFTPAHEFLFSFEVSSCHKNNFEYFFHEYGKLTMEFCLFFLYIGSGCEQNPRIGLLCALVRELQWHARHVLDRPLLFKFCLTCQCCNHPRSPVPPVFRLSISLFLRTTKHHSFQSCPLSFRSSRLYFILSPNLSVITSLVHLRTCHRLLIIFLTL